LIKILEKGQYGKWYVNGNYSNNKRLEDLLNDLIEKQGYKIIGMNDEKIILFKDDSPSRR